MTQTPQSPESLQNRVTSLERGMLDLRAAAEALLQTVQIHQGNFETVTSELQTARFEFQTVRTQFQTVQAQFQTVQIEMQTFQSELEVIRQRQRESDERFEIMLSEFRQMKIESDARFAEQLARTDRLFDRLFNQQDENNNPA